MKDNIKAGAEIHAGDGGYSLGTQEKYEEFVKLRSGTMTPMEKLMYDSGLTAQGCWDQMDSYDKDAIMKLAELIVRECAKKCDFVANMTTITNEGEIARKTKVTADTCALMILQHFGIQE